jgi:hypothetical protein
MWAYLIVLLGAGRGGALRHDSNVAALRLLGSGFPNARDGVPGVHGHRTLLSADEAAVDNDRVSMSPGRKRPE